MELVIDFVPGWLFRWCASMTATLSHMALWPSKSAGFGDVTGPGAWRLVPWLSAYQAPPALQAELPSGLVQTIVLAAPFRPHRRAGARVAWSGRGLAPRSAYYSARPVEGLQEVLYCSTYPRETC